MSAAFLKGTTKKILKFKIHIFILTALFILVSGFQGKVISLNNTEVEMHADIFKKQLAKLIDSEKKINNDYPQIKKNFELVGELYKRNGFKPLWTINYALNRNSEQYIELLSQAHYYGLDSNEYGMRAIRNLSSKLYSDKNYLNLIQTRIEAEIILTGSCIRFINALEKGILFERLASYDPDSLSNPKLISLFNRAISGDNLKEEMKGFQPSTLTYIRLQKALEKFLRSIELNHSIATIPNEETEPEKAHQIAKNILLSLSYAKKIESEQDYIVTLKKFQKMNNLEQTGELDKKTRRALIDLTTQSYQKVALNLERLKFDEWIENNYLLVNIPSFQLRVVENNSEVATFKTIIGKPVSPTPVFSGKIEKIVTHPSWIVPQSISKELLYKAKSDSTFLERNKYVVYDNQNNQIDPGTIDWQAQSSSDFDYKFIQQSNPSNALGIIKFLFPNNYSVYIHDTPSRKLFSNDYRAYSHGCVRLENPQYLAEYIIKKQAVPNWEKKLKNNLSKGVQEIFELQVKIDIHLRYYTCEASEDGELLFYDDIYNLDNEMMLKLNS